MLYNNKIYNILSIENSSNMFSVCFMSKKIILYKEQFTNKNNSVFLINSINDLLYRNNLKIKDIGAIAYGTGPGSYTGVRLINSIIQGLSFCWKLPVISVSSMQTLAMEYFCNYENKTVLVGIDTKINEIYYEIYETNKNNKTSIVFKNLANNIEKIKFPNKKIIGIGTGCMKYKDILLLNNLNLEINIKIVYPKAFYTNMIAQRKIKQNEIIFPINATPNYIN